MRIITTSDWHLGSLFHGNDRLPEHKHFLNWLIDQIREQQPDALLVAGDVFDNGNPSAAAQSAYYEFLAEVTRACPTLQIIITAGNHDSASRLEAPRQLLSRHRVEVRGTIKRQWLATPDGRGEWCFDYDDLIIPITGQGGDKAIVLAVPHLRSDIMMGSGGYSEGVNTFLHGLTSRCRELFPDTPVVMMAHMYARGAEIASQDASERIIVGGQEQVSLSDMIEHPDYLTCGHIHKRQRIGGTDWARYTGSVLPMSFAEKDYTHSVDLVTLTADHRSTVEHLIYTPQRQLIVLPENNESLEQKDLKKLIKGRFPDRIGDKPDEHAPYLALNVRQECANNDQIKELEMLVDTKNAILCRLQKIMPAHDVSTAHDTRPLTSIDNILNRDPLEAFLEAFAVKHNTEMSERQQLLLSDVINHIKNETND